MLRVIIVMYVIVRLYHSEEHKKIMLIKFLDEKYILELKYMRGWQDTLFQINEKEGLIV